MKAFGKLFPLFLICLLLVACGSEPAPTVPETTAEPTTVATETLEILDWADDIQPSTDTLRQAVTVKSFIDGDTVHFLVPQDVNPEGVLKARFLAVNTPESTGKIEEYGKAASTFTKEKLSQATSIIIESETSQWDPDSTGERYLVWVWYKTAESESYRNLNIELLQNGLALANNAGQNQYGETCLAAVAQARSEKLNLYSGK